MQTDQIDWQAIVRPHDQLVCSHMTSEPVALLESLGRVPPDMPFGVMLGVPFTLAASALPAHAMLTTYGGMGTARALARSRALIISRTPYSQCEAEYLSGKQTSDVVLASLSRAPDGRFYLGASHGYIIEAARRARVVVAEINARAPCVLGSRWPDDIAIQHAIEVDYALAPHADGPIHDVTTEALIAAHVAAWVPDGACLQVGIGSLPLSVAIAILRYRLYDLDRIISRTLSYAVVTGLLVAAYVGSVATVSRLIPSGSSVAVAASTLAVAAAFQPLRRRVQAAVDRQFNRSRYDAGRTVEAFSRSLREQVDLDVVRSDLLDVVHVTLQPSQAALWLRRPETAPR